MATHKEIKEIKMRYTDPENDEPDLKELAEEYDIPHKILLSIASRENWKAARNGQIAKLDKALELASNQEITSSALDIVKARSKMFKDTYDVVETQLPQIMQELLTRMESMNDRDLIAYAKTLTGLSLALQKMIDAVQDKEESKADRGKDGVHILDSVTRGKIAKIVNTKGVTEDILETLANATSEQDDVFKVLDER